MKKIAMGSGTIVFDQDDVSYELPTSDCNVTYDELAQITHLPGIGFSFDSYFTEDHHKFVMRFFLEDGFFIYERVRSELNPSKQLRLAIANNLLFLGDYFSNNDYLVTLFHPLNFFVHESDGTVLVLYRGLKGQMPAPGYEEEPLVEQIKRMILLLFTSARYENLLLNGNSYANRCLINEYRDITKRILRAKTIKDLQSILADESEALEDLSSSQSEDASAKEESKPQSHLPQKKVLIGGGIAVFALAVFGVIYGISSSSGTASQLPPTFIEGLRYAALQDYAKATQQFQQTDMNDLSPEYRQTVVEYYVNIGEIDNAQKLNPDYLTQLAKSQPLLPGLQFEKAVMLKDYEKMTELKDQIYLNQRRYKIIIDAYLKQKKFKSAETIAKDSNHPQLIQYVKSQQGKK